MNSLFFPSETSDHHTLGGKDEWGKKKRNSMKYSGATMNSPRSEGGFMSAPWRYMKKGNDDDDGATSNMKLPLVND